MRNTHVAVHDCLINEGNHLWRGDILRSRREWQTAHNMWGLAKRHQWHRSSQYTEQQNYSRSFTQPLGVAFKFTHRDFFLWQFPVNLPLKENRFSLLTDWTAVYSIWCPIPSHIKNALSWTIGAHVCSPSAWEETSGSEVQWQSWILSSVRLD